MSDETPDLSEFDYLTRIADLTAELEGKEEQLRKARARVKVEQITPVPDDELHKVPLELLDGQRVRFGLVSDTHLGSKVCALAELNVAYDWFAREGIAKVLHTGDVHDGVGVYKGQHAELTQHTFDDQVTHSAEHYPQRPGVETFMVAGNHDLEGDFTGSDPVRALADRREDITHLGRYSAWVEIAPDCEIHLIHGRGSGSYALSYKLQRMAEAYTAGRKPHALIVGHFHAQIVMQVRGIQAMLPGCFQGQTPFSIRLGLQPAIGFHVVEATIGDDGSIVEWAPRWKPMWEGRVLGP